MHAAPEPSTPTHELPLCLDAQDLGVDEVIEDDAETRKKVVSDLISGFPFSFPVPNIPTR
jgi:hypothetical protein